MNKIAWPECGTTENELNHSLQAEMRSNTFSNQDVHADQEMVRFAAWGNGLLGVGRLNAYNFATICSFLCCDRLPGLTRACGPLDIVDVAGIQLRACLYMLAAKAAPAQRKRKENVRKGCRGRWPANVRPGWLPSRLKAIESH